MVPLGWTLLVLHFLRHASADEWCNPNTKFYCNTTGNQLIDLSCGWCRSWTFASNICGNKLRIVGLDGGALPGDGDPTRDYMVETSLDQEFNLTQGDKWKLSLIPQGYPKLKGGALWSNPSNTTLINYGLVFLMEYLGPENLNLQKNAMENDLRVQKALKYSQSITYCYELGTLQDLCLFLKSLY